jgi:hypothetical protein
MQPDGRLGPSVDVSPRADKAHVEPPDGAQASQGAALEYPKNFDIFAIYNNMPDLGSSCLPIRRSTPGPGVYGRRLEGSPFGETVEALRRSFHGAARFSGPLVLGRPRRPA